MKKPRVVVTLEGGTVQAVTSDTEIDLYIIDFDTDGAEEIIKVNGFDAYTFEGVVVDVDKDATKSLIEQITALPKYHIALHFTDLQGKKQTVGVNTIGEEDEWCTADTDGKRFDVNVFFQEADDGTLAKEPTINLYQLNENDEGLSIRDNMKQIEDFVILEQSKI